ncbi:MAG: DUF1176 domain-containing protein [Pseudomonadota bacterium]
MNFGRLFLFAVAPVAGILLAESFTLPAAAQGISERARDWWVTCRDDLYCIAETPGTSSSDPEMQFKIERSNKENGKIYVTVSPSHKLELGMRVDISVLGMDYEAGGKVKKVYKGNEMAFTEKTSSELLLNLRKGKKGQITVKFGGDIGTVVYDVSLTGVTTALLLMDQVQQRLDRVDAAIAWGGEPVDSLSAKREPQGDEVVGEDGHEDQSKVILAHDTGNGKWATQFYNPEDIPDAVLMPGYRTLDCAMEEALGAFGARGFGLGDGHDLYLVACQNGDVNINHYVAMVGPKHGNFANTYEFELPLDYNQPNRSTITSPNFDNDTQTLTSVTYHSQNYDCGIYEKHQYVADGDFFELVEYREKSDCDGVTGPPEGFPLVWTIDELGQ